MLNFSTAPYDRITLLKLAHWENIRCSIGVNGTHMTKDFILFFQARSGSSHLISLMDSHPAIVAKNEILGHELLPDKQPNTRSNQLSFLRTLWDRSLATEHLKR